MLSLIVALASPTPAEGECRFALSHDATTGLARGDAGAGADSALADHGSAPLALLPRAGEVVAMVPARMLSWHRIALPKVNSARLRNALDGLLEERLLDEPQSLHFALAPGAAPGNGSVWVAACDKAWLHTALQAFESAGRPVARVVPEYAPLPAGSPPTLHVTGSPDSAWLVRCADDGVQTLPLGPGALLALGVGNAASGDGSQVHAEPAVAALAEQVLATKVRVEHSAQGLVAAARSSWDLAQFDLASTGGTRLARRAGLAWAQWAGSAAWRPARWGLLSLVLAQLLGLNAWAWKERAALEAKGSEARSLLTRTFPKVPVVVDAPVQMEREVAALRQAAGAVSSRDLEPMLATIAENVQTAGPPSAIEFAANEMTLKGFQPPPAEASALASGLAAAGYSSRVEGETWVVRVNTGVRP
ncbi:MAG: type II secretion system protein GspL [Polaromonas sp.]